MIKANSKKEPGSAASPHKPRLHNHQQGDVKLLRKGIPLVWFAILAFLLFGQTINYSYTYLDDQTLILGNMEKLQSSSYLPKAFSEDVFHTASGHGFYYRPILTLSFMADAMIGKGSFSVFHFSNIIYHVLATFLLFLFLVEMGYDRTRSFLFSLIFLVHPMVTQAVAWVPGRNDTLLAIFILGSFLFWLKYLKKAKTRYLIFHMLFYILALLTKENAIVLPLMIVLYSAFILKTPLKNYAIAGPGWLIFTVIWAIIRYHALGGGNSVPLSFQLQSIFHNLPGVLPFIGKTLFPFDLSVFPILTDMKISIILGIMAIAVLAFLVGITKPKQWFQYFFGIIWFMAFLLPSFISVNNQVRDFSEHRSYLSLVGILLLILACNTTRKADFSRILPVSVVAGICLLFAALTFIHTRHFKDQITFWRNAVDTSPSHAFNYNNLGAMYFLNNDLEKAEPMFRKALQINPVEPMANSNTGLVCMRTDRPAEAEKYYLEEIRINPGYDHVYYNLGLLYYNHARYDEGIQNWEKTLTINPGYTDAYKALLFAYDHLKRKADYERIILKVKENGIVP
jgi:Tfp pilus assembly protein PilF